jgi:LmbE family N-acetylglucosaminyl deacetylase
MLPAALKPTLVLEPSARDAHRDHHGVALIAERATRELAMTDRVLYSIVHSGSGRANLELGFGGPGRRCHRALALPANAAEWIDEDFARWRESETGSE